MNIEMSPMMKRALTAMNQSLGTMYLTCQQEGLKVVVCDKERQPVLISPKQAFSRKRTFNQFRKK